MPSAQTLPFRKRGWPLVRLSLRNLDVVAARVVVAAPARRTSYEGFSGRRSTAWA